jgi:hypothetical protein
MVVGFQTMEHDLDILAIDRKGAEPSGEAADFNSGAQEQKRPRVQYKEFYVYGNLAKSDGGLDTHDAQKKVP